MVHVLCDEVDEGINRVTVEMYDDNHRFDVMVDGETANVEYQETLNYRGEIVVREPNDDVWEELVGSKEFLSAIPDGVKNVRRVD